MKILKELDDAKLVIVDLEVNLGNEIRNAPTLCAKYKGKIIPLKKITDEEIKKEWIIKGQNEKDRFKFSILIQDLKKELGLNGFPAT